jgi:hypothetical protein
MTDTHQVAPVESPAPVAAENTTDSIALETSQPIKTSPIEAPAKIEVAQPVKPRTSMDALKDAKAKIEANEKPILDAKAQEKPITEKTPITAKVDDKTVKPVYASKPVYEPPPRWAQTAKEKWEGLDDEVKHEVTRTVKELENGYVKHKESADKWMELKEFEDLATSHKVTIKDALKNYTALEKGLVSANPSDKIAALEEVFRVAKITPKEYAAYINGQTPDQVQVKSETTIRNLETKLAAMESQLKSVTGNIEQETQAKNEAYLNNWAKDKPLVDQLATNIAEYVNKQGLSLDDAYAKSFSDFQALAAQAGFIPHQQAPTEPILDLTAQTRIGKKAIVGAPSLGSYPATQKPSNSAAEAVRKAFAQLG